MEALAGVLGAGLLLGVVHILAGGLPSGVDFLHSLVDAGDVAGAVGGLQFVEGVLDGALLVGGQLVAVVLQVLLALEDHTVGSVDFLNLLFGLLVVGGVGLGLGLHTLDFVVAQAAAGLDADVLALAGGFIQSADVEDAVGVDVESDLNLGHSTRCWRYACQVEAANGLVVGCHRALALQHVDFDLRLVVGSGREDLRFLGRDGGVGVDQTGHHATEGLDTQRKRCDIKQQHILHLAGQHTALDGSADGDHLVGVDTLVGGLAEEFLDDGLDGGDTRRTAHEDHLVDVAVRKASVLHSLTAGFEGSLDQVVAKLLKFSASQLHHQVLRHAVGNGDVRQVDFGLLARRKLDFSLLGSLFQTLHSHRVLAQVDALVALEAVGQPVDDLQVEVVAAQVRVAVGRLDLEHAVAQVQDRDIERTATEVEDGHIHILILLVQTVGQSSSRRLVDDTAHLKACNFASLFGSLTLTVVEVGRHGDDGFGHLCAQEVLGGLLHFLKHDSADFLRSVEASVDVNTRGVVVAANHLVGHSFNFLLHAVVGLAHKTLDRVDRVVRVGDGLTLGGVAHLAVAVFEESDHRRGGAVAFAVHNDHRLIAFHNADAAVGRS